MSDNLYGLHAVLAVLEKTPESLSELWVDSDRNDKRIAQVLEVAGGA